ncbi:MAG: hypothetical protein ACPL4I_12605 [Bacteroidota bacterium]
MIKMTQKIDLKTLVKSAGDLAYALRDTLDVLADHERRIKTIEEKLQMQSFEHARTEVAVVRRAQS